MRVISAEFMSALLGGVFEPIRTRVVADPDLELFIRDGYINVYYKGASLLKLKQVANANPLRFEASLDPQYTTYANGFPQSLILGDESAMKDYAVRWLRALPLLKDAVIAQGYADKQELAFEQLFIHVNNRLGTKNVKSEYFIVDRQYVRPDSGGARPDLLGIYWPAVGRRRRQTVSPVLFEIKYGLNQEIATLDEQVGMYVTELMGKGTKWADLVDELQKNMEQRAQLGLFGEESDTIGSLTICGNPKAAQVLVLLFDYNPRSALLDCARQKLCKLRTDKRVDIRLASLGYALWDQGQIESVCPPVTNSGADVDEVSDDALMSSPSVSLTAGEKNYLLPRTMTDIQGEMYRHLTEKKWAAGVSAPGDPGNGHLYDTVIPDYARKDLPHIYTPIRANVLNLDFKRHRMFFHMASSQAACLNLFLPILLHQRRDEVLRVLRPDLAKVDECALPAGFRFEYSGAGPGMDRGPLNDKTKSAGTDADLAIEYTDKEGQHCIWLIEHKLTEAEFTQCGGAKSEKRVDTVHDCELGVAQLLADRDKCYYHSACGYEYWNITDRHRGFFVNAADHTTCPFRGGMNQLWRNQLLGFALIDKGVFDVASFSVVKHPRNHDLDRTVANYEALVGNNPAFSVLTSDQIVDAAASLHDSYLDKWVAWYRAQYALR